MIARDVSERERAEERVRSERDLSQAIIDSLPGAFALLGESRHFLRWNRNLEQVARVSAAQVAAVDALSFFDGPDRETFAALLDDALTNGRSEAEAAMSVRGGARLPYLFSARRIDVDGQACILYSGIDVSALKRAEAALADKTHALEASNAELEQFAYVASHDLREPLRMVSAYVGLLERRYADRLDADAREFIAFARDGATRMDRLILDLLEYSRVGRKGAPLVRFESVEAVEAALANLGMAIDAAGAEIRLPEHLPAVVGDRGEIVRLFQNLIGNAIKYRHPERPPVVHLAVAPAAGGRWRFTVADNGIGIPEGDRERVFMIFQRLHARSEIEGSGIGLAICRKVVDRHGGRIWVEASPEGGSAFVFTLPGEG
ncbi:MAG: PAS domain S-box protein [Magnetospirillum sp.]|nr:PAS domain S-box protein [Magnetospirillum sp.]